MSNTKEPYDVVEIRGDGTARLVRDGKTVATLVIKWADPEALAGKDLFGRAPDGVDLAIASTGASE